MKFGTRKLQNLFHLSCGVQIRQIWIQLITVFKDYYKTLVTDLYELNRQLPDHSGHLTDSNFFTRLLYNDIY